MKFLLDTHLLLWAASDDHALPKKARALIKDNDNTLLFSVVSLWEIVIKSGLGREDFQVNARVLRRHLLDAGFQELLISADHIFEVGRLAPLHKDPFDRMLVAQAISEGIVLLTHDEQIRQYGSGSIRFV